jgi:hypothetical protein
MSIRIHLKYEQYEDTKKKNYEKLETNGIRFKDSNNKSTFIYIYISVCVWWSKLEKKTMMHKKPTFFL